jgi:peptide/nickel transport system substrate-binding protein
MVVMQMAKIKKVTLLIIFILFFISISFSGCTSSQSKAELSSNKEQKLVVADAWELGSPDPAVGYAGFEMSNYLVLECLVGIAPDYKLTSCIAESWEPLDNYTWRFHLKKNIKFHDGSKLVADDVVFSLNRSTSLNPVIKTDMNIRKISKVDDYTVDIMANSTDPSLPARVANGEGCIYSRNSEQQNDSITKPLGTGPFKFISYDKATDTLQLGKNEYYWGPAPKLDTVIIKSNVGDPNTREAAIEKGQVDFTTETPLGSTKKLMADSELNVTIHPICQGYKLKFGNVSEGPFSDVRVRKAVAYAVNRNDIVDNILLGRGEVSNGNGLVPGLEWRNNDIQGYSYDVQKAKELLSEAGWKDTDNDGILDKEGKPFKIPLLTYSQRPALPPMAQAIQSDLKSVGIDSEISIMDWPAMAEHYGDWGMMGLYGGDTAMWIPDPSYYLESNFLSESAIDYHYKNEQVDRLLLEARTTFNEEKRYNLYKQVQKIVIDTDCAQVHLAYQNLIVVTRKDVKGYIPNPAHHDYSLAVGMYRE